MDFQRNWRGFTVTDDPSRVDFDVVHGFLTQSYWCRGIDRETVEKAATA